MEISLREYRQEDFDTLWQIDQRCFAAGIAYSRQELMTYIRWPKSFTLVAELVAEPGVAAGAIAGFLVAEAGRRSTGHLITIDVLAEARRYGVGSQLLQAAEDRLRAAECRSVYLETAVDNAAAIAFYKRHGYFLVKTVPRYYSNGIDALVLEKDLISRAQAV